MTRTTRTIRGIPLSALFQWRTATLGFTLLGVFYLLFPWFTGGIFDEVIAMFGMMFLSMAIIRAKTKVTALGGLFAAFLGLCYFFGSIAFIDIGILWIMTIVFFALTMILELGYVKLGPVTSQAKAFIIVPLALLSFSLILAFIGKNPVLTIDFSNIWVAANYISIMLFSLVSMLEIAGWKVMGAGTNKWIMLFAIAALATAFLGAFQGTLFQWR